MKVSHSNKAIEDAINSIDDNTLITVMKLIVLLETLDRTKIPTKKIPLIQTLMEDFVLPTFDGIDMAYALTIVDLEPDKNDTKQAMFFGTIPLQAVHGLLTSALERGALEAEINGKPN